MTHLKKKDGLWILQNDKNYCVGLTKEMQEELGDVSFVSLPKVGQSFNAGEPFLEIEAEKAVSEFRAPLTGKVASINEKINQAASFLNTEDELEAWILSFKEVSAEEFDRLV